MRPPKAAASTKTPEQLAAPGWRKAKGGLFWVLIGLFFLALPGFVPFGKQVYERAVEALPTDVRAALMVALIQQLYQVERAGAALPTDARRTLRVEHSVPLLAKIAAERDALARTVLPKSPLGRRAGPSAGRRSGKGRRAGRSDR